MRDISAAILAGGLGTRLRSVVNDLPKVLAPVAGRPFIAILLDQLAEAGVRNVTLLTGYKASQVRDVLGEHYSGMALAYSSETIPLGTAGAVRQALPTLKGKMFLLLNGDSYCDVNLAGLVAERRRKSADLTLSLARVPDAGRFGQVSTDDSGNVTRFGEKENSSGPGWINAGIYVLTKSLAAEIPPGQICSLERDMLPDWVKQGRVRAVRMNGRFLDIGTPESYAIAEDLFNPEPTATANMSGVLSSQL